MAAALAVPVMVTLAFDRSPFVVVGALFVLVVPFEKLFPRHRQRLRRRAVGTDVAYALASPVLRALGLAVAVPLAVGSLLWLPGLALRPIVSTLPSVPRLLVGFVLFDVSIYWAHRFSHEVPFLWRFHAIHHSTRQLDWVSGFRNHPLDGAFFAPAFVLLVTSGFAPRFAGALAVIQIASGLFLHANVRWRWRPLQKLVITPEFHHWHHADEPDARNTTFSTFLPAWDLLFGTYYVPSDRRPQTYGVQEPVPDDIVGQLWFPFHGLRNPLRMARHPWRSAKDVAGMLRRGAAQMAVVTRRTRQDRP